MASRSVINRPFVQASAKVPVSTPGPDAPARTFPTVTTDPGSRFDPNAYKPLPGTAASPPAPVVVDQRGNVLDLQPDLRPVGEDGVVVDEGEGEGEGSAWDDWANEGEKLWDAAPAKAKYGAVAAAVLGIIGTGASFYIAARVGRTSRGWLAPVGAGFLGLLGTAVVSGTVAAATGAKDLLPCGASANLAGLGALQAGARLPQRVLRGRPYYPKVSGTGACRGCR